MYKMCCCMIFHHTAPKHFFYYCLYMITWMQASVFYFHPMDMLSLRGFFHVFVICCCVLCIVPSLVSYLTAAFRIESRLLLNYQCFFSRFCTVCYFLVLYDRCNFRVYFLLIIAYKCTVCIQICQYLILHMHGIYFLPSISCALPLFLHFLLKTRFINRKTLFRHVFFCQFFRKPVRIIQAEYFYSRKNCFTVLFFLFNDCV